MDRVCTFMKAIDSATLRTAALAASKLLKVLANPDRLMLLYQMTQGEYCVSELEELTGIRQPTLSQQLTVLRNEQLVNTRRKSKQIYYSIVSDEARQVMRSLYELYCFQHDTKVKK